MDFFDLKRIAEALKEWRVLKRKSLEDVFKEGQRLGIKSFTKAKLQKVERADCQYGTFFEVFAAYGIKTIKDFDIFLDYVQVPSLDSITFLSHDRKASVPHDKLGFDEAFRNTDDLGLNRTRISEYVIRPGGGTPWHKHEGHEYILVLEGAVKAEFSESQDGKRKCHTVAAGDAIAFSSQLFHTFTNDTPMPCKLIVARPADSLAREGMSD